MLSGLVYVVALAALGLISIFAPRKSPLAGSGLWHYPLLLSEAARSHPDVYHRPIYAYSVIPGGAYLQDELAVRLAADPTAREHYSDVIPASLTARVVAEPIYRYVSFRKGGRIAWTRHRVRIAAGETILTNDVVAVRARCGNRLSETPRSPVLPSSDEPSESEFDRSWSEVGRVISTPAATVPVINKPAVKPLTSVKDSEIPPSTRIAPGAAGNGTAALQADATDDPRGGYTYTPAPWSGLPVPTSSPELARDLALPRPVLPETWTPSPSAGGITYPSVGEMPISGALNHSGIETSIPSGNGNDAPTADDTTSHPYVPPTTADDTVWPPDVQPPVVNTPEPRTGILLVVGILGLAVRYRCWK